MSYEVKLYADGELVGYSYTDEEVRLTKHGYAFSPECLARSDFDRAEVNVV